MVIKRLQVGGLVFDGSQPPRQSVRIQSFRSCDPVCLAAQATGGFGVQPDQADHAYEVPHIQWRGEVGGSPGGHYMGWPGDVISHHLTGILTQEETAGAGD